jgi:hypothetical protein
VPNNNNNIFLSFTSSNKNVNNIKLGTILNNEANVFQSFFSDFQHGKLFFNFQKNQNIYLVSN